MTRTKNPLRVVLPAALVLLAVVGLSSSAAGAVPGGDGTIVFQSSSRGGKPDAEIWARSANGKLTDLTKNTATDVSPVVSPDGRRIAFSSTRSGHPEIFTMSITGGKATQVTHDNSLDDQPTWSPDGKQIAFLGGRAGHNELYVINADGTGERRLTNTPTRADNEEPSWSPDGTRIAYTSNSPKQAIYTIHPDGSNVTMVTPTTILNINPDWSPDSTRIAFADQNDLWLVPSTGGTPTRLTHRGITTAAPAWSPDGSKIAFWSRPTPGGNNDIFVVEVANPSSVTQLTNDVSDDRDVDWQPTGALTSIAVGGSGCPASTTARLGRVQWNFTGATPHTAVDATGLGLFDAGSHTGPYTFWSQLTAAGLYTVDCGPGGTLPSKVSVPVMVAPARGRVGASFMVTWATQPAPSGAVYDVQWKQPGAAAFTTWQSGVSKPSASFKAAKSGSYAFEARVRKAAGGGTDFSTPTTIHVR